MDGRENYNSKISCFGCILQHGSSCNRGPILLTLSIQKYQRLEEPDVPRSTKGQELLEILRQRLDS